MTAIHLKKSEPAVAQGGDGYSRCPADGCIETKPTFRLGADKNGQERGANIHAEGYTAKRELGGCGYSYAPATPQGVRYDRSRGIDSRWRTPAAAASRTYLLSPDSDEYRSNYERIFGHD